MDKLQSMLTWEGYEEPLIWPEDADHEEFNSENNIFNPYSKASCFILYLYSMEFGCPPLYQILNLSMRTKDTTKLAMLGPYAFVLMHVCMGAEKYKNAYDKIESAKDTGFGDGNGPLGIMEKSFLLFRGGRMHNEWIEPYE